MKNRAFKLVALMILSLNVNAQDKIEYKSGQIHCLFIKDKEILTKKPMGKEVSVTYDTFYKSYFIFFVTEEGWSNINLDYISDEKNLKQYKEKKNGDYYYVLDNMSKTGDFIFVKQEKTNGIALTFKISGLKKE